MRPEIHHADEGMAGYAVTAFLTFLRARVKIENDAHVSRSARDGQAGNCIAEGFLATGLPALQPVDVAKGHAPGSETLFQIVHHFFQGLKRRLFRIRRRNHRGAILFFTPQQIQGHGNGADAAHMIPIAQLGDRIQKFRGMLLIERFH